MKTVTELAEEVVREAGVEEENSRVPFDDILERRIAEALTAFAEERLAQRDLEQFGEAFMLNGKRIAPNEIHKSTADYVKEARAEALEQAAKELDVQSCSCAERVRALKGTP